MRDQPYRGPASGNGTGSGMIRACADCGRGAELGRSRLCAECEDILDLLDRVKGEGMAEYDLRLDEGGEEG